MNEVEKTKKEVVYSRHGAKGILMGRMDEAFLVHPVEYHMTYDGNEEEYTSSSIECWEEALTKPPRPVQSPYLKEQQEKLATTRRELADAERRLAEIPKLHAEAMKKVRSYDALVHLEALMNDEIKYVVDPQGKMWDFKTYVEDSETKKRRMISLVHDKDGPYWVINRWADGSGIDTRVNFYRTMEEAKQGARTILLLNYNNKRLTAFQLIQEARSIGITLPNEVYDDAKKGADFTMRQSIDRANQSIEKAIKDYEEVVDTLLK